MCIEMRGGVLHPHLLIILLPFLLLNLQKNDTVHKEVKKHGKKGSN